MTPSGVSSSWRIWRTAIIRGILADGILEKGFTAADDAEFRDWLKRHGASRIALASAPVREIYDLCFAYEEGDLARPNLAAGTATEIALRIAFTYKGSVMYRMQAGMGDTVFAPIYEVLKRSGVKFAFFHEVRGLHLRPTASPSCRFEWTGRWIWPRACRNTRPSST